MTRLRLDRAAERAEPRAEDERDVGNAIEAVAHDLRRGGRLRARVRDVRRNGGMRRWIVEPIRRHSLTSDSSQAGVFMCARPSPSASSLAFGAEVEGAGRPRDAPSAARELRELAFRDLSQLADEGAARLLEPDHVGLELASIVSNAVELALALRTRLAQDELRLSLGLLANFGAQLLRGHERLVERLVALAERAQLLVESARLGVELLIHPRQTLELFRDLIPEVLHFLLVVAAKRLGAEVVASNVERREVKGFIGHRPLSPNRTVPRRTMVAPSSTASS